MPRPARTDSVRRFVLAFLLASTSECYGDPGFLFTPQDRGPVRAPPLNRFILASEPMSKTGRNNLSRHFWPFSLGRYG